MIINIGGDIPKLLDIIKSEKNGELPDGSWYDDIQGKVLDHVVVIAFQNLPNPLLDKSKKSNTAQTPANLFRNRSVVTTLAKFNTVKQR